MKAQSDTTVSIPGPKGLPALGNLLDIDIHDGLGSLLKLFDIYGPIYKLKFNGKTEIFVGSQALVNELCDEKRFVKCVTGGLEHLRPSVGDGLFTAYHGEPGWGIAHRILMPVLGPMSIRSMFNDMDDLCEQLCLKWARGGNTTRLDIVNDYTRLTLDTIGLCAMDYRFNSFYQGETMHPFVKSMLGMLSEAGLRGFLPDFTTSLRPISRRRFEKDISFLRDTSRKIIQHRRENPTKQNDLLNSLLSGRDPISGEGMSDELIINNLITFLVAGHETTSGLLSFATYYLLKNPVKMQRAVEEVDRVIGSDKITVDHLSKLPFLDAALKETLRLMPTAPGFTLEAKEPQTLGSCYDIPPGTPINVVLAQSQKDPVVFGPDATSWKPERMLDAHFRELPPNAWKPFGNGARGCIGRPFAWQESLLVLATVLKTFTLELDNPSYDLKVKETLTIKPDEFFCRATLRHNTTATNLRANFQSNNEENDRDESHSGEDESTQSKRICIMYGSNMGTCRALAYRLASSMRRRGIRQPEVRSLQDSIEKLRPETTAVIVTSSYDGEPTDDAKQFLSWLNNTPFLTGVNFAVFGCGHHDWTQTFHKIPRLIDALMEKAGATRIASMGSTDVAVRDPFADLETWEVDLWTALGFESREASNFQLSLQVKPPLRTSIIPGLERAVVVESRVLTGTDQPQKLHMELKLEEATKYRPGDHIRVLPHNSAKIVSQVLAYFHLSQDAEITLEGGNHLGLPPAARITALELLTSCVELSKPATAQDFHRLIGLTDSQKVQDELRSLSEKCPDRLGHEILPSVFDVVKQFKEVSLSLETFVSLLHPIQPRTYSASSAPGWHKSHISITLAVVRSPSWDEKEPHRGVASHYLAELEIGSAIYVALQPAQPLFHPPATLWETPVIMICAGSGLGPFRGFIQDRIINMRQNKHRKAQEKSLAPACLFFGSRTSFSDLLYKEEHLSWQTYGAVEFKLAFSRESGHPDAKGCRYVQDRMLLESGTIRALWDRGAIVYVCGSRAMGDGVRMALEAILDGDVLPGNRYIAEIFTH